MKVRNGGGKEISLIQGKEERLCFAGAAVKRYPMPKVKECQRVKNFHSNIHDSLNHTHDFWFVLQLLTEINFYTQDGAAMAWGAKSGN